MIVKTFSLCKASIRLKLYVILQKVEQADVTAIVTALCDVISAG